jgi:glycosyltransferase involved in cell wall biosynthesis
MKIAHVITTINYGGAEKQLLILAKQQIQKGAKVTIIPLVGISEMKNKFKEIGCEVNLSLVGRNFLAQSLNLKILQKENKYSLLHAHLPRSEIITALAAIQKENFVITRHNTEKFVPFFPALISSFVSRKVLSKAKKVICISPAVKNYIKESHECRKISKLVVINYGYDPSIKMEQNLNINSIFSIGTVARLEKQKNLEILIGAFADFQRYHEDSTLTIVGKGSLEKKLKDFAKKLSIDRKIIWINQDIEINSRLQTFSVFVLPSLYEGFGLVYLEAIQAGIPILSSDNLAAIDIFDNSNTILFKKNSKIELTKKLILLLEQSNRLENLKECSVLLKKYNPEEMCQKTLDTYVS